MKKVFKVVRLFKHWRIAAKNDFKQGDEGPVQAEIAEIMTQTESDEFMIRFMSYQYSRYFQNLEFRDMRLRFY